jgi:pantothenate kinase
MKLKVLYLLVLAVTFAIAPLKAGNGNDNTKVRQVSGKIVDAAGESLAGAKLVIAETGETFYADLEGKFQIKVSSEKNYTIKIHSLGYQVLELPATNLFNFDDLILKEL